jgi:NAD(P)-dependent dehydrogenase (short-subunit alcohol dehydrogenase family)
MLKRGRGTIIFSGATGSIRGGAGFAAFAVPKFALRALAQSMARELGPKGLHVAHVILDGMIAQQDDTASATELLPAAIAEAYYQLHRQHRSAWTHEIDLRPSGEGF